MTFKLLKIFLSNLFTISDFTDGFKKGGKAIAKNIFIMICGLYLLLMFGVMYVLFTTNTYNMLEKLGQVQLFPGVSLLVAILIIFNFGIISVGASYYAGKGEEQFLSMPITPKQFFGAKFGTSLVTESIIGIFLFAISSGYYGYKQGLLGNPLFYIGTLVTAVTAAIVVISIIYIIFTTILFFIPKFRNKKILNGISTCFIFLVAIGIGFSSSFSTGYMIGSGNNMDTPFSGIGNLMVSASKENIIFDFLGSALQGNIIPILLMIGVSAVILFCLLPLIGTMYVKTFEGASDEKTKKISSEKLDKVVKSETKRNSVIKALYIRDVKGVFREPTFFANGPLMIFLFPLILIACSILPLAIKGELGKIAEVSEIFTKSLQVMAPEMFGQIKYYVCFGGAAFALFIVNLTSVASTSFSREGKGLSNLKAMPIKNEIIVKAKFLHAFTYVIAGYLLVAVLLIALRIILRVPFNFIEMLSILLIIFVITGIISSLLIIIDMLFDTLNPKLQWETPAAAFKQNMNTFIAMLVSIGTVGLFIAAGILMPHNIISLIIITVIFGIITIPVGFLYMKYAKKKISKM